MFKIHSVAIGLMAALAMMLAGTLGRAAGPDGDVKAAYSAWDAAFQKADAKAIAAFYTDDALFLPANHKVIEGPAGVQAFFQSLFDGGATDHKLDLISAGGEGNLVYAAANWKAMGKKDGKPDPWAGVATHIFQKQPDGKLKIKLHTFN